MSFPWFHHIRCNSVNEFFSKLDEYGIRKGSYTPDRGFWLFRGQNDASKPLLPSALRDPFQTQFVLPTVRYVKRLLIRRDRVCPEEWDAETNGNVSIFVQRKLEDRIIRRFAEFADEAHLDLPTDSKLDLGGEYQAVGVDDLYRIVAGLMPTFREPTSVIDALAQHHRIPTRLMDWTRNPMVAAFFAAYASRHALPALKSNKHLRMGVWAVQYLAPFSGSDLKLVTQLRSRIGNLKAQDGVFIYDSRADNNYFTGYNWMNHGEVFHNSESFNFGYKFTIPFSEREHLLWRLEKCGVVAEDLYPTKDATEARDFDAVACRTIQRHIRHPESLLFGGSL